MSFEDDFGVSEIAQPYQNDVYCELFPVSDIVRYQKGESDERHILDREHHIDVEVILENGITLTGQEKALRHKWSHYNTFTVEFYQVASVKEEGEFFNLGAQFYLHSYLNESRTGLCKWYLVDVFDFFNWLKHKSRSRLEDWTKETGGSRASFYNIDYRKLPDEAVYASHKTNSDIEWSSDEGVQSTEEDADQYADD